MSNVIINADTDSIMIGKSDGSPWSEEEQSRFLDELNSNFSEKIVFEHDGIFSKVLIIKAKNYVLIDDKGKTKVKGSSIKDQKKPMALQTFLREVIHLLLDERPQDIMALYNKYVKSTKAVTDIKQWSKKITITDKVLNPTRTTEQKQFDAIQEIDVQEGDKVWVYFKSDKSLGLAGDFNGDYDREQLLRNIHMSLKTFKYLIDFSQFPNYTLKRNKVLLESIDNE